MILSEMVLRIVVLGKLFEPFCKISVIQKTDSTLNEILQATFYQNIALVRKIETRETFLMAKSFSFFIL